MYCTVLSIVSYEHTVHTSDMSSPQKKPGHIKTFYNKHILYKKPARAVTPHLRTVQSNFSLEDSSNAGSAALLFNEDCVKARCAVSQPWIIKRLYIARVMQSYHASRPLCTSIRNELCS